MCLEACWAGTDNISAEKQAILEDADLDYGEDYGWEMKNAVRPAHGSRRSKLCRGNHLRLQHYRDEVGNTKIGRPIRAQATRTRTTSSHPTASILSKDFADNIISIRNSYCGSIAGDASISDYVKSVNPDLDAKMIKAIDDAITEIRAIPEPFTKTATAARLRTP